MFVCKNIDFSRNKNDRYIDTVAFHCESCRGWSAAQVISLDFNENRWSTYNQLNLSFECPLEIQNLIKALEDAYEFFHNQIDKQKEEKNERE